MSKVMILADLQADNHAAFARTDEDGYNTRLLNIVYAVHKLVDKAIEEHGEIDYCVLLGDIFDNRRAVDSVVLDVVSKRIIENLTHAFEHLYIVAGNHDLSDTGELSTPLNAYSFVDKIDVITQPKSDVIFTGEKHNTKVRVGFIPWTKDTNDIIDAVDTFVEEKVQYVFAHLGMSEGTVGPSHLEVPQDLRVKDLSPEKFRQVILAHYHNHQQVAENVWYVGSPLQHDFGERNNAVGAMVLDLEKGKVDFIENDFSPRFVLVTSRKDAKKAKDNDYVKVVSSTKEEADELFGEVKSKLVIKTVKPVFKEVERMSLSGLPIADMLKKYMDSKEVPKGKREQYLESGLNLLREAGY